MIYVEKSAQSLPLTQMVAKDNNIEVIDDGAEIEDKKSNVVISNHKDNFVHRCPATNIYRCCNYHVVDIMQGCPFDCAYCILQLYLPHLTVHTVYYSFIYHISIYVLQEILIMCLKILHFP